MNQRDIVLYSYLKGKEGGGGSGTPSKLVLEVYEETDVDNQYPRQSWDGVKCDNEYFEYTNFYWWVAKKDFEGIIFLALYTYQPASAATKGSYYTVELNRDDPIERGNPINVVSLRPCVYGNAEGLKDSDYAVVKIKQGDRLKCGKENGFCWDAAYLYVFEVKDTTEKVTDGNISFTQNRGKSLLSEKFEIVQEV